MVTTIDPRVQPSSPMGTPLELGHMEDKHVLSASLLVLYPPSIHPPQKQERKELHVSYNNTIFDCSFLQYDCNPRSYVESFIRSITFFNTLSRFQPIIIPFLMKVVDQTANYGFDKRQTKPPRLVGPTSFSSLMI
ncbi:hypothetical protein Hanom_Chr03g00229861 [Helianthus anomalus]